MYIETYRMDTSNGYYTEGQINSEDEKPVDGVVGGVIIETDTGKVFFFDNEASAGSEWVEQFSFQS
jgi:hypothetical protein